MIRDFSFVQYTFRAQAGNVGGLDWVGCGVENLAYCWTGNSFNLLEWKNEIPFQDNFRYHLQSPANRMQHTNDASIKTLQAIQTLIDLTCLYMQYAD